MSSSNSIVRKAYADFARGDVPAVFAVFDPAMTWHVPATARCRDYTGHAQIGGFFQRTLELSKAERRGAAAAFPEVHVWRMKDGKAIAFREYQGDEQREDRFWA